MRAAAACVAILSLIAGCAGLAPVPDTGPIQDLDLEPRPTQVAIPLDRTADAVEVARGSVEGVPFTVTVHGNAIEACFYFTRDDNAGGGGCGRVPPGGSPEDDPYAHHFGIVSVGPRDEGPQVHLMGFLAPDVAAVVVRTNRGEIDATLVPLAVPDLDAQFFLTFLPRGATVRQLAVLDGNGIVLEEYDAWDLFPGPPGEYPIAVPDVEESP